MVGIHFFFNVVILSVKLVYLGFFGFDLSFSCHLDPLSEAFFKFMVASTCDMKALGPVIAEFGPYRSGDIAPSS